MCRWFGPLCYGKQEYQSSGRLHVTDLYRIPNQHGLLASRMLDLDTTITLILSEEYSVLIIEGSLQASNS